MGVDSGRGHWWIGWECWDIGRWPDLSFCDWHKMKRVDIWNRNLPKRLSKHHEFLHKWDPKYVWLRHDEPISEWRVWWFPEYSPLTFCDVFWHHLFPNLYSFSRRTDEMDEMDGMEWIQTQSECEWMRDLIDWRKDTPTQKERNRQRPNGHEIYRTFSSFTTSRHCDWRKGTTLTVLRLGNERMICAEKRVKCESLLMF